MPDFVYTPLFTLERDTTPYGVLTRDHVAAGECDGRPVLKVAPEGLTLLAERAFHDATNVGWTPLFPRLSAIVTDVGAPLSHAAIVARELGIPAVVGCGNATMLLNRRPRPRGRQRRDGYVEINEIR